MPDADMPIRRLFQTFCYLPEREIRPGISVTFSSLVNLTQVEAIRSAAHQSSHEKLSYTTFVLKALAQTLQEFPFANARVYRRPWWPFGPSLQRFSSCDVAVAVERDAPGCEAAAFVDVLRNADASSHEDIHRWLKNLAESDTASNANWRSLVTLARRLPAFLASWLISLPRWSPTMWQRYRGGAALISSPGKYGVDALATTWAWPLGITFGLVKKRPMVIDDAIVAVPSFVLAMNFDRRVMAGAPAGRFFRRLVERLEQPQMRTAPTPAAQT